MNYVTILMLQENGGSDGYLGLEELEQQHNLTLQEMQRFIQVHGESSDASSMSDVNTQILACVVQLISFEVKNHILFFILSLTEQFRTVIQRWCQQLECPSQGRMRFSPHDLRADSTAKVFTC